MATTWLSPHRPQQTRPLHRLGSWCQAKRRVLTLALALCTAAACGAITHIQPKAPTTTLRPPQTFTYTLPSGECVVQWFYLEPPQQCAGWFLYQHPSLTPSPRLVATVLDPQCFMLVDPTPLKGAPYSLKPIPGVSQYDPVSP